MPEFIMKVNLGNVENAEEFVNKCNQFDEDIDYHACGSKILDAKSIMGVMTTNLKEDVFVKIHTNNPNTIKVFEREMSRWTVNKWTKERNEINED